MQKKFTEWLSRSQTWGFFVSLAVMAIVSIAFFYPDNFDGNSLQQPDMLQGMANTHEAKQYYEATGEKALWTGSLFSGMPTTQISPYYASEGMYGWIHRAYGLWLPQPSNYLFMMMLGFLIMLYCVRVRWWVALMGAIAWAFSSYYIIIIGAGHIWKLMALSYVPPTIGGLLLCYRGRYLAGAAMAAVAAMMQLSSNHPQMTYYFAFVMLGLAIAYAFALARRKRFRQWLIATGCLAAAGCLAVGANMPNLYNTYLYAKETKRQQSELTPLPSGDPERDAAAAADVTGGLPKSQIVGWSYGQSEMLSLLVPNIKGGASAKPIGGRMQATSLASLPQASGVSGDISQYLYLFPQYFNDSEGTNGPVYVGAIVLALFLVGCVIVRGPMKWALIVLTILSILLALGRNFSALTDWMIYNFPLYNKFRAVESILVIAEFTMPMLAVLALARLVATGDSLPYDLYGDAPCNGDASYSKQQPQRKDDPFSPGMQWLWVGIAFGLCALVCLVCLAVPSAFGPAVTSAESDMLASVGDPFFASSFKQALSDLRYGMVRADAWRSLLFLAIGGALLLAWLRYRSRNASAPSASVGVAMVISLLVLADLFGVDRRYVSHESFVPGSWSGQLPAAMAADDADRAILEDGQDLASYRVMDVGGFWDSRRSYYHKMVGGYHAAKLNRYEDLIQRRMGYVLGIGYLPELRIDSIAAMYPADQQPAIQQLRADYRVLDMLNARYIIGSDDQGFYVDPNPYALGNAWFVGDVQYVDGADAEMAALETLDPATQAVADRKFMDVLGPDAAAPAPADAIELVKYSPNRLEYSVSSQNGGIGVFSEVYFPWGWKATIDGRDAPLARVNYVLRAMRLPAGSHQVVMTFDPDSVRSTVKAAFVFISLIYLLVIAAVCFAFRGKKEQNGVD